MNVNWYLFLEYKVEKKLVYNSFYMEEMALSVIFKSYVILFLFVFIL